MFEFFTSSGKLASQLEEVSRDTSFDKARKSGGISKVGGKGFKNLYIWSNVDTNARSCLELFVSLQ